MTAKKSFFIILRIVFIYFSLNFIKDAFFYWDGYSYYMRFIEFLPDLSLVFILWTILGVILAFALWLIVYGLFKIIPKSLALGFEHIMVCLLIISIALFIKRTYFGDIPFGDIFGLSHFITLLMGGVLVIFVIWFVSKYINFEKMLYSLNYRITPVVWIFTFLLILAVPFSLIPVFKTANAQLSKESTHVISQNRVTPTSDKKRPNIILVTLDSLTALDMQLYGYKRPTTPFISEWAKDAVVFKKAYALSNWTTPTVMSLMTGQMPWTHKVWYRACFNPVSNYENSLPGTLKNNGYVVYGFVQIPNAHIETLGIGNAFLVKDKYYTFWLSRGSKTEKIIEFFVNRPIIQVWIKRWMFDVKLPFVKRINFYPPETHTTLQPSEMVYNRSLEYISQNKPQQPFFAWLHLYPPHFPYLPPAPYMGVFGDAEKFNSEGKQERFQRGEDREYKPEEQEDVDILRKRYDEFVLYSDKQFELFLSRLSKTIDMSNTIIILSSDHGESFSHGYLGHVGTHLYEPLVHIPLIIKIPGGVKAKIGVSVSQIDIAPTILELAGIPIPTWMEGQSLIPLLIEKTRFKESKPFEPKPMFSMQLIKNRSFGHPITKGTIAVWDGDYKLIYYLEDNKKLLFNLKTDPHEAKDISESEESFEITKKLTKLIDDNLVYANNRITQPRKK